MPSKLLVAGFTVWAASLADLPAASLQITSPAVGTTASGVYDFAVDASGVPTVDRVEYRLNSLRLGIAISAPFKISWNTGYAADGNYSLQAFAYDATGAVVATADRVFNIQNRGCSLSAKEDLSLPLSGKLTLTVMGNDPMYYPARWSVFLDGTLQTVSSSDSAGQNSVTMQLPVDTMKVVNGEHELHVEVASVSWPNGRADQKSWHESRLSLNRMIRIDNGRIPIGIATNLLHVYMNPGQKISLQCRTLNADGSSSACVTPSYESSDPKTAGVDKAGTLTAHNGEGFSRITVVSGDHRTEAYVWVRKNLSIPHFSGDGRRLTEYQNGLSIFPVSPFMLQIDDVKNEATDREAKRAGINTLNLGFYTNPRNLQTNIQDWLNYYDTQIAPQWTWAAQHGYHLYLMGDEIARNIGLEAWWTLNWPFAKEAVQHAMESVASSRVAIAADMIDEGSSSWGGTTAPPRHIGEPGIFTSITCDGVVCAVAWPDNPVKPGRFFAGAQFALTGSRQPNLNTPPLQMFSATHITNHGFEFSPAGPVKGSFTAKNDPNLEFLWWAGNAGCPMSPCNPPVPNTALETIADWLRSSTPHVPISWPALGVAPPVVHGAWAGKNSRVSDFFSHYWDSLQGGHTYRWSNGVVERVHWMREAFYSRQPYADLGKPQVMLDSISSFYYGKRSPGNKFDPLRDDLYASPASPANVSAGMMTAAAIGNAGLRLYQYDTGQGPELREQMGLGGELQSGASPTSPEDHSRRLWRAMGYAANLLTKTLQPFVLGTALSSPALGENIVTAVRRCDRGVLLMAINANDWNRELTVDLRPYQNGNAPTRYVVQGSGIQAIVIPDAASDAVNLPPGATLIYLFPRSKTDTFLSTAGVSAPTLPPGAVKAFVRQTYIFSEDLDSAIPAIGCTDGCNLALDRSLGDSFLQFSFVDARGVDVVKGPIQLLAAPQ